MALRDTLPGPAATALRTAAHVARRARGVSQIRSVHATGSAPTQVVEAIRTSLAGRYPAEERVWFDRIERNRAALLASVEPLELVDFGAGKSEELGADDAAEVRTLTRSLGHMTRSSKPAPWARLLFSIVRRLEPDRAVELGSCVGVSACYQAAALELNGRGHLHTLEGSPVLADRSAHTLREVGLGERATVVEGQFSDRLDGVLSEGEVQYGFIDGHHLEEPTLAYMEQFLPAMGDEGVLVFDDVNWSPGMRRAWEKIAADPRFALTIDMRSIGLAVVSASATTRHQLSISYH